VPKKDVNATATPATLASDEPVFIPHTFFYHYNHSTTSFATH